MPAHPAATGFKPDNPHRLYHQEPARRPMMAIINPAHLVARTPKEPQAPPPNKKAPRLNKVQPLPLMPNVFPSPGSGDELHEMMRHAISTASSTTLPAITPRSGMNTARGGKLHTANRGGGNSMENVEHKMDYRHFPVPVTQRMRSVNPNIEPTSPISIVSDVLSETTCGMGDDTWIDVASRPSTKDGKETSREPREPQQKPEYFFHLPSFANESNESSTLEKNGGPSLSPDELIDVPDMPVTGIGSVSVHLMGERDQCLVMCSNHRRDRGPDASSQDAPVLCSPRSRAEAAPHVATSGVPPAQVAHKDSNHTPANNDGQSQKYEQEEREYKRYLETSAYVAKSTDQYAPKDLLAGTGFSKCLIRLADPRSRVFQYPTPSEALYTMTKRPHARLQAPSSSVVMVGARPPTIDPTYYTLKQMKRQWLMQYGKEHDGSKKGSMMPEGDESKVMPSKRLREDQQQDLLPRPPSERKISSRPVSRELLSRESRSRESRDGGRSRPRTSESRPEEEREHSVCSPWQTDLDSNLAVTKRHGHENHPVTTNTKNMNPASEPERFERVLAREETDDLESLDAERPDVLKGYGNLLTGVTLPSALSPVVESSLDISREFASPQLQLGLHFSEAASLALLKESIPGELFSYSQDIVEALTRSFVDTSPRSNSLRDVHILGQEKPLTLPAESLQSFVALDSHSGRAKTQKKRKSEGEKHITENKRNSMLQEMAQKQYTSDGNRILIRCEQEILKKHLKRAMASLSEAYGFYAKAGVLYDKQVYLDKLRQNIYETAREYHAFKQENESHSPPPLPPSSSIRVTFRGPDRLQPDGMCIKTREDFETMRQDALEKERQKQEKSRQEAIKMAVRNSLLAEELQRLEEYEKQQQTELKEPNEFEEQQRKEALEEQELGQFERKEAAESETRSSSSSEEQKRNQAAALEGRSGGEHADTIAVASSFVCSAEAECELIEADLLNFADLAKVVAITASPEHLLDCVAKEAEENGVAASVERVAEEIQTAEQAEKAAEQERRAWAAQNAATEEATLVFHVSMLDEIAIEMATKEALLELEEVAEAIRSAEEGARRAVVECATEETAKEFCENLLDEILLEFITFAARYAHAEVMEEAIAERKRLENEAQQRAEQQVAAAFKLEASMRCHIYGLQYARMLLDVFAQEERIRKVEEQRRRAENEEMARQQAAETLQAAARFYPVRNQHVAVLVAAIPLEAFSRRKIAQCEHREQLLAAGILQAASKQLVVASRYCQTREAATICQSLVRAKFSSDTYIQRCKNICSLQASMRSNNQRKLHAASLSSQGMLRTYVRRHLAYQDYRKCFFKISLLQAVVRRNLLLVHFNIRELCFCATILQTKCRRKFAMGALNRMLAEAEARRAVVALEPFLQRKAANHHWSSYLLAAGKVLSGMLSTVVATDYTRRLESSIFLQRIMRRNCFLAAYQKEVLEIRRIEEEERKRLEEEEKERRRAEEVGRKQKEFMEVMEAKNKAMQEAAEAERAKEAERKRKESEMLAQYSQKTVKDEKIVAEEPKAKKMLHCGQGDNETFAMAVAYEKDGAYVDAISTLMNIMDVPALRMACLLKRATCLGKLGMRQDCLKDFQAAIKEFPDEHLPFYMRSLHHVQWKNDELATRDIQSCLHICPNHVKALNLRASLAFKNGFYVDAISVSSCALSIDKNFPQLYIIRGSSREKLGLMKEACDDLELAISMTLENFPRNSSQVKEEDLKSVWSTLTDKIFMTYCDTCLTNKDAGPPRALRLLTNVINFSETRGVVFALRARVYCAMGKFAEAEDDFESAEAVEEDNANVLLLRAQFTRKGNPTSAISDCIRAAELEPDNVLSHFVRGKIHEEQRNSRDALDAYIKVLDSKDEGLVHYQAALRAGTLKFKLAESSSSSRQDSFALLQDAARIHAPKVEPLLVLARFLEASGSYKAAVRELTRVIHMAPTDPRNYLLRSHCLLLMGNKASALRDGQIAMQLDNRTSIDVMQSKVDNLINAQEYEKARSKLADAIDAHPNYPYFKTLLAKVHYLMGDIDAAKVKYDEGCRIGTADSRVYGGRGEFRLKTGHLPEAVDDYTMAIKLLDGNTKHTKGSLYTGRGEARLKTGQNRLSKELAGDSSALLQSGRRPVEVLEEALFDLNEAIVSDPKNKKALHLRAVYHETRGNCAEALNDYESILALLQEPQQVNSLMDLLTQETKEERDLYFFEAHMKSGLLCTKRRIFSNAIEHYNHVLKMKPDCVMALLHRGVAWHSHGYHESGIADYSKALTLQPAHRVVLQNRAKAFAFQKNWKRAISDLVAISENERDAEVWSLLATCYSMTEQKKSAIRAINFSLNLDGLSLQALISKADILEDLYPLQREAMSSYSRALRLHPGAQLARLKHALAAAKRGFIDVAMKQVHSARQELSKNANVELPEKIMIEELSAIIMLQSSMPAAANLVLNRLLESSVLDGQMRASILTTRGVVSQQGKDMVAARTDFSRAVEADPTDAEAHYNLGCFRMEQTDWRGAYASFTKTISLHPKHTLAMLNRGVALYQMNRAPEALRDFNAALTLQPDFAQALMNRGVMHQIAGRFKEAEQDLTSAIEMLHSSPEALQCRINLYQSTGQSHLALIDNALLIATTGSE